MLTIHQASAPRRSRAKPKIGLAVAGGGPVGAIYELGALHALDESIDGFNLHELDVYVGVSAGAFIAASLANGISTIELCRIFKADDHAPLRFQPERFLRPAYGEYFSRAKHLPAIMSEALLRLLRRPAAFSLSQLIGELGQAIPSGIFDNETINSFLEQAFRLTGRHNRFDELPARLIIVAVDLDSGAAVRFGTPGHDDISISRAVQASAALPGLYPPVEIDGRYYVDGALRRTLHASAALDEGVDLLLGINPLVPFDAGPGPDGSQLAARRLIQGGLPLILSQTFRALIQSRMKIGFAKYRSSHAAADLVLLEPDREDEQIFFTNIFSYSSRNALCEHAYQATRRDLLARADELEPLLAARGMVLRRQFLRDQSRKLADSLGEGHLSHTPLTRDLSATLDELERQLGQREAS
ncbi:MAG TPA: patatin-like phospholipase family protein [Xanthomonadales bacterium]|nr:patatin-like phospholipase family protein [Xanthomonadales bacterium]